MEINILNIKCTKKLHSTFESQFMKKFGNTEVELKKKP